MRGTRASIAFFFFADGLLIGSWAARLPAVQRQIDAMPSKLGLALFAMSLGALLSMPVAGWLGERIGSRAVASAALFAAVASLVLASRAGDLATLAAALLAFGGAFGAMNVAGNAQGVALERAYGRSILSSFHAAFSTGGLVGAGIGALAAARGIGVSEHFAAVAVTLAVGQLVLGGRLLRPSPSDLKRERVTLRPPRRLLALGAAAFFTLLAEGAAADWSAIYLSDSRAATGAAAALGYTAFALAMATSRIVGDRLNDRYGAEALARSGSLLAAGGLTLGLVAGSVPAALAGFAAMGAGLGFVVPVLFRAAASVPGVAAGVGIATVSTIGWLGFLAGPPLIGVAAGMVGLRSALAIVVVAIAVVALLSARTGSGRPRPAVASTGRAPRPVPPPSPCG